MEELLAYRRNLLTNLEGIVTELRQAAASIPAEEWHAPRASGQPAPHQVLAHLRALESQAIAVRLRRILDESEPYLPLFDDEGWMDAHYDPNEPVQSILDDYAHLRQQELAWLMELPSAGWNRTARHPWWGVRALQWWVEQALLVARQHLEQLS
jgi:uncharacterized damage-inducible protein DinB